MPRSPKSPARTKALPPQVNIALLAASIASDLFTDGEGRHATRLVMEHVDEPRVGGGWCQRAVAVRIADALRLALPAPVPPRSRKGGGR